jgi:hypothetical protein
MAARTDRAPGEAATDDREVRPNLPDHHGARVETMAKRASQVPTDRSLMEQFVQNLMIALGAWTV